MSEPNEKSLARQVLADNIKTLMNGSVSLRQWALSNKLHPVKVRRALKMENGASVETLQEIADATGRQPWELLAPGMKTPTPGMSAKAAELARLYDEIEDPAARRHAYAIARLALTGQIPDSDLPDAESEPETPSTQPTSKPVLER